MRGGGGAGGGGGGMRGGACGVRQILMFSHSRYLSIKVVICVSHRVHF